MDQSPCIFYRSYNPKIILIDHSFYDHNSIYTLLSF